MKFRGVWIVTGLFLALAVVAGVRYQNRIVPLTEIYSPSFSHVEFAPPVPDTMSVAVPLEMMAPPSKTPTPWAKAPKPDPPSPVTVTAPPPDVIRLFAFWTETPGWKLLADAIPVTVTEPLPPDVISAPLWTLTPPVPSTVTAPFPPDVICPP